MTHSSSTQRERETSRAVDRNRCYLDARCDFDGVEAAKLDAVAQITASVLWLDQHYGARRTYDFVQGIADQLIAVDARCVPKE